MGTIDTRKQRICSHLRGLLDEYEALEAENATLRDTLMAVLQANVRAVSWEDDEQVVTINGKPVGPTISRRTGQEVSLIWAIVRDGLRLCCNAAPATSKEG